MGVVSHRIVYHHAYANMNFTIFTGENMVRHSVSLVKVKDPFMKRSGASRLTMIATDGESLLNHIQLRLFLLIRMKWLV